MVIVMGLFRYGAFDDLTSYISDGSLLARRQHTVQVFDGTNGIHLNLEGPDQDVLVVKYPQMTKTMAENFLRNSMRDGRIDSKAPWLTRSGFTKVRFQSDHEEWLLDLSTGVFNH